MQAELDAKLQHEVLSELEWDPCVDSTEIGVAAKEGVITLTWMVNNLAEKKAAEFIVKRVFGVRAVADDIQVRHAEQNRELDSDLAQVSLKALQWNAQVPDEAIQVTVRQGFVSLEGKVGWWYQKEAAENSVSVIKGVKGVINNIELIGNCKPVDIQQKIEEAFRRNAVLDARRVGVRIRDGKVILHGNVRSWAENAEAERAAWAAPGVKVVENRITVTP